MGVPTGIFDNFFPVTNLALFNHLSANFSISISFDFWLKSVVGKLVLYFLVFSNSLGLLLMPVVTFNF